MLTVGRERNGQKQTAASSSLNLPTPVIAIVVILPICGLLLTYTMLGKRTSLQVYLHHGEVREHESEVQVEVMDFDIRTSHVDLLTRAKQALADGEATLKLSQNRAPDARHHATINLLPTATGAAGDSYAPSEPSESTTTDWFNEDKWHVGSDETPLQKPDQETINNMDHLLNGQMLVGPRKLLIMCLFTGGEPSKLTPTDQDERVAAVEKTWASSGVDVVNPTT
jgi:hypothetical protein